MSRSSIERRIFVVGVPRSGTTLLQSLLAAHSRLTSFTESHLFSRHFRLLPLSSGAVLTNDPLLRVSYFLRENGAVSSKERAEIENRIRRVVPAPLLRPLRTRAVARELLRVLDQLTTSRGSSNWVEKTPRHLRFAPFLERLCDTDDRPRFVHVIRTGLEVVASLHVASQRWQQPYDLATCVRRWNTDVAFSLSRASAPHDSFVFYEDLTSRPEATLKRLFKQLELDWEPALIERYAAASSTLITRDEVWKHNVSGDLRTSSTSGAVLNRKQRERVSRTLRRDLYEELHRRTS